AFFIWFIKNYREVFGNIKKRIKGKKIIGWVRYPFDLEIVLLLIVSIIAAGIAYFSRESLGIWKAYFFEPILFFILLFNTIGKDALNQKGSKWLEKIIWPLALSCLAVSVLAVYQKFTGQFIDNPLWAAESTRRVVSFFGYPNAVGLFLGPISLVLFGWMAKEKENLRAEGMTGKLKLLVISLTVFLSWAAIIFAKSTGAALGVAAGLIVFALLGGKRIRLVVAAGALIMVIGIAACAPARNYAIDKITLKTVSGEIRKQQWEETWNMLKDGRLLSGAGLDNYQTAIKSYHQEGIWFNRFNESDKDFLRKIMQSEEYRKLVWQPTEIYMYPHNIFLNFWSELGLAGLLLFVWIIGKYFYLGLRRLKDGDYTISGLIGAMAVIVVHGLVDVPYFKNDLSIIFWLFVFMLSAINLKANIKKV
ncbi:MAG: O-antigen ligase family protein, partial [Patescibacteria group bacterium]